MKKRIVLIGIVASLAIMGACSRESAFPGASFDVGFSTRAWAAIHGVVVSGKLELQSALAAKKQARTWRMKTEMRLHPGEPLITISEVSCPDHQRMTGKLGRGNYETIRIGADAYVRNSSQSWHKSPATPDFYPCGDNPGMRAPWAMMNEGRDLTTTLLKLVESGKATPVRGPVVKLDGETCQEWRVQFGHPDKDGADQSTVGSKKMSYSICLNTKTHLPQQIVMGTGGVLTTYYDWNAPIEIQAPGVETEAAK